MEGEATNVGDATEKDRKTYDRVVMVEGSGRD